MSQMYHMSTASAARMKKDVAKEILDETHLVNAVMRALSESGVETVRVDKVSDLEVLVHVKTPSNYGVRTYKVKVAEQI